MDELIAVKIAEDIPEIYRDTPIGRLLRYHNLGEIAPEYKTAQMLIGMCMDNRKQLKIPDNFAYILRSGGANLRDSEFKISFAVAIGGISTVALIGHNYCGMVGLASQKEAFITGLMERGGWNRQDAEEHFDRFSPIYEIGNEIDFVRSEVRRRQERYPKLLIVPLFYRVEDNKLYFLKPEKK